MASTALDIITGALLNINAYSPAEPLSPQDSTVGLNALNDLLDSLSNDKCFIYTQIDNQFVWINGQYQYSVGNPIGGTFTTTLTAGSTVAPVSVIPSNMVLNGDLSDVQAAIPVGTTIVAFDPVGLTVTMSQAALFNSVGLDTVTYTTPGDIKIPRPLRFNSGFTRANSGGGAANIDYSFEMVSLDRYKEELLKNVQGPWPYIACYQPTFPLGTLYVYPAPAANYTGHLFTDLILSSFANTNTPYALPQGYTRALKKLLALELAPTYGKTPHPLLMSQAKEAKDLLKSLNDSPVVTLNYDSAIARSQTNDASWSQTGGFY